MSGQDPNDGAQTPQQWFNTAAFVAPAQFTYGNAGQEHRDRAGDLHDRHVAHRATSGSAEPKSLQFRLEAFNVFNSPVWGDPNLSMKQPDSVRHHQHYENADARTADWREVQLLRVIALLMNTTQSNRFTAGGYDEDETHCAGRPVGGVLTAMSVRAQQPVPPDSAAVPEMPKQTTRTGKHVNRVIDLWLKNQPVYYSQTSGGGYEQGKALAATKADYITYEMEHGPLDFKELREFMRGLVEAGPTRTGHKTPPVSSPCRSPAPPTPCAPTPG